MGNNAGLPPITDADRQAIGLALGRIPSGLFIVTAAHEDRRLGMVAGWVQQVCFEPAMVSVSIAKGRPIMPLISESRRFALCQIAEDDRLLLRKFSKPDEMGDDPFLGHDLVQGKLHPLPILKGSASYLECELACHMDFEGDHDLFVGNIRGAGGRPDAQPLVHLREDGFAY